MSKSVIVTPSTEEIDEFDDESHKLGLMVGGRNSKVTALFDIYITTKENKLRQLNNSKDLIRKVKYMPDASTTNYHLTHAPQTPSNHA